jgi:hypothetical protein
LCEFEVEGAEKGDEEALTALGVTGDDAEGGGEMGEVGREAGLVEIDADTDDGVAEGGVGVWFDGGFNEDAAEFVGAEEDVVGPAKVDG